MNNIMKKLGKKLGGTWSGIVPKKADYSAKTKFVNFDKIRKHRIIATNNKEDMLTREYLLDDQKERSAKLAEEAFADSADEIDEYRNNEFFS